MTDFLAIFNAGAIVLSVISGLIAGIYLAVFHPRVRGADLRRRSLLVAWYFASLGSIYYIGRIAYSLATNETALGRVVGGLFLWILFSIATGGGAYVRGRERVAP